MNKARRKEIQKAIEKIEDLVQQMRDDEEDAFNSMPEGLQESENGLVSQEAQENLEAAIDALEEAISYLEDIV